MEIFENFCDHSDDPENTISCRLPKQNAFTRMAFFKNVFRRVGREDGVAFEEEKRFFNDRCAAKRHCFEIGFRIAFEKNSGRNNAAVPPAAGAFQLLSTGFQPGLSHTFYYGFSAPQKPTGNR